MRDEPEIIAEGTYQQAVWHLVLHRDFHTDAANESVEAPAKRVVLIVHRLDARGVGRLHVEQIVQARWSEQVEKPDQIAEAKVSRAAKGLLPR